MQVTFGQLPRCSKDFIYQLREQLERRVEQEPGLNQEIINIHEIGLGALITGGLADNYLQALLEAVEEYRTCPICSRDAVKSCFWDT